MQAVATIVPIFSLSFLAGWRERGVSLLPSFLDRQTGLPIALYYLGESGLARAGIIAGFLMILQNLLSVISLQLYDRADKNLPALILLCSPTATIVYVMAKEMHGDAEFTVAAVSAGTLFSAITFIVWLTFVAVYCQPV